MISRLFLLLTFFSCCLSLHAGEGVYAVSRIDAALLKKANSVLRLDESYYEFVSQSRINSRRHFVITVLNEKGAEHAQLLEQYDKFHQVKSIEGTLYDAAGNKIRSLKAKEIQDLSGNQGMSLADDARYKLHNFYYKVYPFTVEYEVEEIMSQTMFFPSWMPVEDENISVEKSVFKFKVPSGYRVRYNESKNSPALQLTEEPGVKIYTWTLEKFPAIVKEYACPPWQELVPNVMLGPSQFGIEDYSGDMSDWKEFGKFVNALNKGRDELPASLKKKVEELTAGVTTTREKIHILYNYLQSTTRYISIQLGIGGWRPFEAQEVASKSYGDCKALSNYMVALLKSASIPAYYTLIKAGEGVKDINIDFAASQFNHAIVCVPHGKDTTWLECTSQIQSPGYMGGFTGNRHALLITEDGGKLVNTPAYKLKDNVQVRHTNAVLKEDGSLTTQVKSVYKALLQDDLQMMINSLSKDKVKEHLHEELDLATYQVNSFNYKESKSAIPEIEESLEIIADNYATITGKRLFIVPNIMSRFSRKLSTEEDRRFDIVLNMEYSEADTTEIILPEGYKPESIPEDISVTSVFGKYNSAVRIEKNKISYTRSFEKYAGRFKASQYNDFVNFYQAIYKADRNKIVLVKNIETRGF